jgi:hypothetical protein
LIVRSRSKFPHDGNDCYDKKGKRSCGKEEKLNIFFYRETYDINIIYDVKRPKKTTFAGLRRI